MVHQVKIKVAKQDGLTTSEHSRGPKDWKVVKGLSRATKREIKSPELRGGLEIGKAKPSAAHQLVKNPLLGKGFSP